MYYSKINNGTISVEKLPQTSKQIYSLTSSKLVKFRKKSKIKHKKQQNIVAGFCIVQLLSI